MPRLERWDSPDWGETARTYRLLYAIFRRSQVAQARARFDGVEHVPREGPVLLAANHLSWWDPVVINAIMPRQVAWLAKRELFGNPFNRWLFRELGVVPVDRKGGDNAHAMRDALHALRRGRIVGIFPEGTRAEEAGKLLPAKPGVARLALLSGAPVLPVGIASDLYWPRSRALPRLGQRVHVRIGEPVRYDYGAEAAGDRGTCEKVAADVMSRVETLLLGALDDRAREARGDA